MKYLIINYIAHHHYALKTVLKEFTHFGMKGALGFKQEHEVLERNEFKQTELLKKLRGKAIRQFGSSCSGNHFVEFGVIELNVHNTVGIPAGNYMALLSHCRFSRLR